MSVLVYDGEDSVQTQKIKPNTADISVRFPKNILEKQELIRREPFFAFVSLGSIECLPTRYHYYRENGRRYLEYTEGDVAYTFGAPIIKK